MEELASLMLGMTVEDKGEPSFALASGRVPSPNGYVPDSLNEASMSFNSDAYATHNLARRDRQHLIKCFEDNFDKYHQFLDLTEVADLALEESEVQKRLDYQLRTYAIYAVAACFSPHDWLSRLGSHFSALAEDLVFRCIKDHPSDLVVQGLALLAWRELMLGAQSMAYNWIGELYISATGKLPRLMTLDMKPWLLGKSYILVCT
ncbi:hypothetical protein MBLNU459_g7084t1 [Dothideomycetes sp. NU459]